MSRSPGKDSDVARFEDRGTIRWRYRFGAGEAESVRGVTLIQVRDRKIVEALAYAKTQTGSDLGQAS